MQSTIISVKNIHTDMITRVESKSIGSDSRTHLVNSSIIDSRREPTAGVLEVIDIGGPNVFVQIAPEAVQTDTYVDYVPVLDTAAEAATWATDAGDAYTPKFSGNSALNDISGSAGYVVVTDSAGSTQAQINDPIANAYALAGNDPPDEGAMKYWTASIAAEGITDPQAIQDRMVEHIEWADSKTDAELTAFGEANAEVISAGFESIADITGLSQGEYDPNTNSDLKKNCGHGIEDPLAQSFWVPHGIGIYATKVDLYFGTKDQFLPVTVQLRTMKLGLPTTEIIPFGEVVLNPDQVNISDDASSRTVVRFPAPVYLPGGQSYAIVLLSHSNEYTAWISRMGEVDVQTKDKPESEQVVVSAQPTLGSLFKSQNGETWNASQYEDLKFVLYKAQFSNRTGTVNFTNPPLVTNSDDIPVLLKDSLSINSNKIRIGFNTTISDTGVTLSLIHI